MFYTSVFTSRQKLHDEIQIAFILKAVEHLHYPGAISLHQDISLGPDMSHLPQGGIQVRRDIISGLVWQTGDYLRWLNYIKSIPVLSLTCLLSWGSSWHKCDPCPFSEPGGPICSTKWFKQNVSYVCFTVTSKSFQFIHKKQRKVNENEHKPVFLLLTKTTNKKVIKSNINITWKTSTKNIGILPWKLTESSTKIKMTNILEIKK